MDHTSSALATGRKGSVRAAGLSNSSGAGAKPEGVPL